MDNSFGLCMLLVFSDTFFDALYRIKPVSKEKGTEQKLAEFSLQLTTDRR